MSPPQKTRNFGPKRGRMREIWEKRGPANMKESRGVGRRGARLKVAESLFLDCERLFSSFVLCCKFRPTRVDNEVMSMRALSVER